MLRFSMADLTPDNRTPNQAPDREQVKLLFAKSATPQQKFEILERIVNSPERKQFLSGLYYTDSEPLLESLAALPAKPESLPQRERLISGLKEVILSPKSSIEGISAARLLARIGNAEDLAIALPLLERDETKMVALELLGTKKIEGAGEKISKAVAGPLATRVVTINAIAMQNPEQLTKSVEQWAAISGPGAVLGALASGGELNPAAIRALEEISLKKDLPTPVRLKIAGALVGAGSAKAEALTKELLLTKGSNQSERFGQEELLKGAAERGLPWSRPLIQSLRTSKELFVQSLAARVSEGLELPVTREEALKAFSNPLQPIPSHKTQMMLRAVGEGPESLAAVSKYFLNTKLQNMFEARNYAVYLADTRSAEGLRALAAAAKSTSPERRAAVATVVPHIREQSAELANNLTATFIADRIEKVRNEIVSNLDFANSSHQQFFRSTLPSLSYQHGNALHKLSEKHPEQFQKLWAQMTPQERSYGAALLAQRRELTTAESQALRDGITGQDTKLAVSLIKTIQVYGGGVRTGLSSDFFALAIRGNGERNIAALRLFSDGNMPLGSSEIAQLSAAIPQMTKEQRQLVFEIMATAGGDRGVEILKQSAYRGAVAEKSAVLYAITVPSGGSASAASSEQRREIATSLLNDKSTAIRLRAQRALWEIDPSLLKTVKADTIISILPNISSPDSEVSALGRSLLQAISKEQPELVDRTLRNAAIGKGYNPLQRANAILGLGSIGEVETARWLVEEGMSERGSLRQLRGFAADALRELGERHFPDKSGAAFVVEQIRESRTLEPQTKQRLLNIYQRAQRLDIEFPLRFETDVIEKLLTMREQAKREDVPTVFLPYPRADWNGAFNSGDRLAKDYLSRGFRVIYMEADSDRMAEKNYETMASLGGANLILPSAHGQQMSMQYGAGYNGAAQLDSGEIKRWGKAARAALKPNGVIVMQSCSTGLGKSQAPENIVNAYAYAFSQAALVIGPTSPSALGAVIFDPRNTPIDAEYIHQTEKYIRRGSAIVASRGGH